MRTTFTRISIVVLLLLSTALLSQDIKGGDIQVIQAGYPQYYGVVRLYQQTSMMVNRPFLIMSWGDNTNDTIFLNSTSTIAPDLMVANYAMPVHTFPGPGTYSVTVADSFYVTNLQNAPNSSSEVMCLQADLVINPVSNVESSSVFTAYPAPVSNSNGVINYNLGAIDSDGDSLSYQLIPVAFNYSFPPNTSLDPITGDLIMTPVSIGSYLIGIKVTEWRHISSSTMQVGNTMRVMVIDVDSLTVMQELPNNEMSVALFPNPASNELTVDFNRMISDGELTIMDEFGREVKNIVVQNQERMEISVNDLAEGIYYYDLMENGEKKAAGKVVITK